MANEDSELSRGRVFDILSSPRRRYVLFYLKNRQQPVELTELAEELAAWENDITVDELSSQARKRVYVSLYQTHVPKLEEAGLIEYDADTGHLVLAEDTSELAPYLGEETRDRPWYLYYLALAVANVALLAGVSAGVVPLGQTLGGIVVVGSFLLLTIAHYALRRDGGDAVEQFEEPER